MNKFPAILSLLLLSVAALAQEPPPLEAYGALPEVSQIAISPDGGLVAYRKVTADRDVVNIADVDRMESLGGIDVSSVKPRRLIFIDNNHLVLVASETIRPLGYRNQWEQSAAFIYDVRDGSMFRLLHRADGLYPVQRRLGRIVGRTPSGDRLFMPAYVGEPSGKPQLGLYAVETDRRVERVVARGTDNTIDWFIDADARPFIREDFDNDTDLHQIWVVSGRQDELIYEIETERRRIIPVGLTADRRSLIYEAYSSDTDSHAFYTMNTDTGEVSGPVLGRENSNIGRIVMDVNRVIYGAEHEGFFPSYRFFSPALTEWMEEIQAGLPGASVRLVGWSADFDRLIVHASGGWTSGVYLLYTAGEEQPGILARQRPSIVAEQIAHTIVAEYVARDGLTIPALVTGRADVIEAGNAPLIVLPHGGPAKFDRADFDWKAQFFASRGYVVLQPQFRGSTGFGLDLRRAGNGEWGRKMQSDLDDGVRYLVGQEIVDPERVCIVGSSYGGYAALAAGAFSPELYACHVSINGVADIREMLSDERRQHGSDHWLVSYWEDWYGAGFRDREELDAISPAKNTEAFRSPVLLIASRDDTVVPPEQSRIMRNALEREDKDVELVEIAGEDHWLSSAETRLEILRLVADFVEEHL
ncbi:MAG: prolyl oligopeptidase family serine peptidase [Woeseiaceae bacterium]|nr:prolyl oligopeptidase family serine peptidase [Woeseiaceae bacterium]